MVIPLIREGIKISWLITAVVVSGVITATEQKKAASAQGFELERQAEQEKLSAQGREVQRRQQLNKVLAANVLGQAAAGISGEGTPESISLASAKQASLSEGLESLSDRLRQSQLRRQAATTRSAGRTAAASTLLKTGISAASLGGGSGDTKNG